jgi:hypothetical protein
VTRTTSRLPRLDAIGPHVDVPLLPGVGRTWVNRSGRYWRRRTGVSLLWLFMLAVVAVVTVATLLAFWHRTRGGFIVVLTFLAAYTVAVVLWMSVATIRHWNDVRAPFRRRGRAPRPAWTRGWFFPLYVLQQTFIALSFLTVGFYLYTFSVSLLPEPPVERQARLFLLDQLRGSETGRAHV